MEKKEFSKRYRPIRTIFGWIHSVCAFVRGKDNFAGYENNFLKTRVLNYKSTITSSRGFTLIEIITAIGVLSILATMAFNALNPIEQFRKAQDSKRKSDLAQLQRSLEAYYQDFGRYPAFTGCCGALSAGEFPYTINALDGEGDDALGWGSTWAPYMDVLPVEPNSNKFYVYWSDELNNFQSYRIYASLDRGDSDPDTCNNGFACVNIPTGISGCGLDDETCNFGVTSPNISP